MTKMTNFLEVNKLSKHFKNFELRDISFSLPKGYIMGLIGPNGSGKTTTIKLILNMMKRESGEVRIMGLDNLSFENTVKSDIGVVFDSNCFCGDWTAAQTEKSVSMFYPNWNSEKFSSLLKKFNINKKTKIKAFSKGMQMKLMLACAFSYDAKLLILDEPTGGLDPVSRDELLSILSEYIEDGEHSVLFSTHITSDLERTADYITYINGGELFYSGSKDDLLNMYCIAKGGKDEITLQMKDKTVGFREYSTGFEALVKTDDLEMFSRLDIEPATINDIVIFTNRKGDRYE